MLTTQETISRDQLNDWIIQSLEKYSGQTETHGKNRSPLIDKIITNQGGQVGQPYCLFGIFQVLDDVKKLAKEDGYTIWFDLKKTGSSQLLWDATAREYKFGDPFPIAIGVYQKGNTEMGHAVLTLSELDQHGYFQTFEFNTSSADKVERDGEGCYQKVRHNNGWGDMHILGFIDLHAAMVTA